MGIPRKKRFAGNYRLLGMSYVAPCADGYPPQDGSLPDRAVNAPV